MASSSSITRSATGFPLERPTQTHRDDVPLAQRGVAVAYFAAGEKHLARVHVIDEVALEIGRPAISICPLSLKPAMILIVPLMEIALVWIVQKLEQVGHLIMCELLFQPVRHKGFASGPELFNVAAENRCLFTFLATQGYARGSFGGDHTA